MARLSVLLLLAVEGIAVAQSPRLEALETAVRAGETGAPESFWNDVALSGGTPLIECPKALGRDCLVTFLWRGDTSTTNVVVRAEALPGEPADHRLTRLTGTDMWYRTYRFREDARFMYMLSVNDPLTPWDAPGPQAAKRFAGLRTDPMNPKGYVSLPGAPSEWWSEEHPGAPKGAFLRHKLTSEALSGERTIDVYATPGFQASPEITPVLILFDGDESRNLLKAPVILDNLFAQGRIPPMLAVFVVQPYQRREQDLGCNKLMNRFLASELMPWLREEYGIRTAPERAIVAGASFGGLAAACAAIEHPEVFGRVLSQSGSFWWGQSDSQPGWLTTELRSRPPKKVVFYLDVGLMETKGGPLSQLATNRRLMKVLRGKGYDVRYREFNGTHAFPCWRAAFPEALVSLLRR